MKFIINLILIVIFSFLAELFLPWWSIGVVCFLINSLIFTTRWGAFFSGFFGIGIFWGTYAYIIDQNTEGILSSKIAVLFTLPNTDLLIVITAALGAILGGLSSLTGHLLRESLKRKKKLYY